MKTKSLNYRLIISIILILIVCLDDLIAQVEYKIVDTNAIWYVGFYYFDGEYSYSENEVYRIKEDTVIDTKHYYKLFLNEDYIGGIREDSEGVVYFRGGEEVYLFTCMDPLPEDEIVVYNLNLSIGDTVKCSDYCYNIIDKNDSILIGGTYRKTVQTTLSNRSPGEDLWIEGIGSIYGLLFPIYESFEWSWDLRCYKYNGELIYSTYDNCLIVDINRNYYETIKLFPNPFDNNFTIQFIDNKYRTIVITNLIGQVVLERSVYMKNIVINEIEESGIYLIQIKENNKTFNRTIIKH